MPSQAAACDNNYSQNSADQGLIEAFHNHDIGATFPNGLRNSIKISQNCSTATRSSLISTGILVILFPVHALSCLTALNAKDLDKQLLCSTSDYEINFVWHLFSDFLNSKLTWLLEGKFRLLLYHTVREDTNMSGAFKL